MNFLSNQWYNGPLRKVHFMTRGIETPVSVIDECRRLRLEERLSYQEIQDRVDVAQGSLSLWLRDIPLSPEEQLAKRLAIKHPRQRKTCGERSKYLDLVDEHSFTKQQKGAIAEAAILFRMALFKMQVFGAVFDGAKEDWLVRMTGTHRTAKIQVKCTMYYKYGLPLITLRCADGRGKSRRYKQGEFDFIVGYDLRTDTAYVFSEEETLTIGCAITVNNDAAERFDKIVNFLDTPTDVT
jgi:transcriptional regulator with XRE-family HTH domain